MPECEAVLSGAWVRDRPRFMNSPTPEQPVLEVGGALEIQTHDALYTLERRRAAEYWISGHHLYCPLPTRCFIRGSVLSDGTSLRPGFVGRGMYLHFSTGAHPVVCSSKILDLSLAS
jgi:hypothetical protein